MKALTFKKTSLVGLAALSAVLFLIFVAADVWAIGFGSLVTKSTNTHQTGYNAYSFGDIDNNGTLDAVGEGTSAYLSTLRDLNTGSPIYLSHTHLAAISFNFYANALGDLDADGDLDLVTGGPNGSTTSPNNVYYFDNGTNKRYEFVGSAYSLSGNTQAFYGVGAVIADFTNDGKKDVLWFGTGEAVLGVNSTTTADAITFSSFTKFNGAVAIGNTPGNFGFGVGDFNNDGNKDWVAVNLNCGGGCTTWGGFYHLGLGDGVGGFTITTPIALDGSNYRPMALAVGDFNKDGKADFVINRADFSTAAGQMLLFTRNAGNTGFDQTTVNSVSSFQYRGLAVADMDNDTWPDIVSEKTATGPFEIYLNNGSGGFPSTPSATVATGSLNNFALVDVTADGYKDIVKASSNSLGYYPQTVDTTAPTISSVTSTTANGTYGVGASVNVTVNFSEAVTSTGNVTVTLETGTTDRTCTFTVSNASSGSCTYTVQAGDTSADLDTNSVAGTIKDQANNSMTNFTPGTNLAANKALVIDGVVPTVTNVTSSTANGTYGTGTVIPVTVTFSENVTVTGTPQLTLSTGSPATTAVNYASGSGTATLTFNYTVASGNTSSDLDYASTSALALNSGTIRDAASNNATLTLVAPGVEGSLGANKAIVITTATSGPGQQVSALPANVTLSQPNGGEAWNIGSTQWIFWSTSGGEPHTVTLELSTDGGTTYPTVIASGLSDGGAYSWTVPAPATTKARVRVKSIVSGAIRSQDESNADFSIVDPNPPAAITLVQQPSEKPGLFLKPRDNFNATWTTEGAGASKVRISLSVDGGRRFRVVATIDASLKEYAWKVPVFASKKAVLKFEVLDAAGTVLSTTVSAPFAFKTRSREQRIVIPSLTL